MEEGHDMYSQNDEEEVILKHFEGGEVGRFLDIGAYTGKTFSNTAALVDRGWHGTMVEASPLCFVSLMQNYKDVEAVTLVQALVVAKECDGSLVSFWDNAGAVASANKEHVEKWRESTAFQHIYLSALEMPDLLDHVGLVHFVSIDVEGDSVSLFEVVMEHNSPSLSLVCVETNNNVEHNHVLSRANHCGFRFLHRTGENTLVCRS
tara:strand:- start:23 stop:640 length:618 start_codon:yes stop_codon:yes gene_type:complete